MTSPVPSSHNAPDGKGQGSRVFTGTGSGVNGCSRYMIEECRQISSLLPLPPPPPPHPPPFTLLSHWRNRFVGPVVKASASREEDPGVRIPAPRTVSNTYAPVARAQSSANHVQNTESLSRATSVKCHVVRRGSSAVKFDRVEIEFI